MYWLGIFIAVLAIAASIVLHEFGHYIPARAFKVKVTQFMLGFGPTLFSRQRGDTEFGVKALPLGGFIRIVGMTPRPPDLSEEERAREPFWSRLINDTRAASWRDSTPGDEAHAFYRLSPWKKIIVMMGGPLVNLAICIFLLGILFLGLGVPQTSNVVGAVNPCDFATLTTAPPDASTGQDRECPQGTSPSPAQQAGLLVGDRIVAVAGIPVSTWEEAVAVVRGNPDRQVDVVLERGGQQSTVQVQLSRLPSLDAGQPAIGYLGIVAGVENVRQPWTAVPTQMGNMVVAALGRLATMPAGVASTASSTIQGQERPVDSPVSVVGVTRISGEIAAAPEDTAGVKVATLISIIAGVNLFLFLFNMVPLLPLDGGHVASAAWESVRRRLAKLRGKPDPGPVDVAVMAPVAYVFAMTLFAFAAVVIVADIVNPVRLT